MAVAEAGASAPETPDAQDRYTVVAIFLHWAMAAAILFNIGLAWWMRAAIEAPETTARAIIAFQVHKSIGLTILALAVMRLVWRFMHPPPPLPDELAPWERFAAHATHWAFYGLMIIIPLSGWIYVSAGWSIEDNRPLAVPTLYFGLFQAPHLFGLENAREAVRAFVAQWSMQIHGALALATIGLFVLHLGAAMKHWLVDRDAVLARMAPGAPVLRAEAALPPASVARRIALIGAAVLFLGAGGFVASQLLRPLPEIASEPARPPLPAEAVTVDETAALAPASARSETSLNESAMAPPAAAPSTWIVAPTQSAITFSGTHAGVAFEGRFSRWRADIAFDPENLTASRARVTIETGSAATGNPLYDESLPGPEWLAAGAHPSATFRVTQFRRTGESAYIASGVLRLKGRSIPVRLPFRLTITGDRAEMSGRATIERSEADLGMQSDPNADYVSRVINVDVRVVARRAP